MAYMLQLDDWRDEDQSLRKKVKLKNIKPIDVAYDGGRLTIAIKDSDGKEFEVDTNVSQDFSLHIEEED